MNFHISPLSPLRPRLSSPNLGAPRPQHPARSPEQDATGTNHDAVPPGPVKIEVEPADADDETTNDTGTDDTDDSLSDDSAEEEEDDVTQDSRDVLVQRLTDLAERLSAANVRTSSIEALHKQVDEMERTLRRGGGGGSRDRSTSRHSSSRRRESLRPGSRPRSLRLPSGSGQDALGIMAPMSPSWLKSQFQRRPSMHRERETDDAGQTNGHKELSPRLHSNSDSQVQQNQRPPIGRLESVDASTSTSPPSISSEVAEDVVKEAEKLCAEMATVIENLQTRREESDHLHAVLVQREEVANKRIYEKTAVLNELEDVVADNEAELRHLRLELRAIEVQCMGYIPKGADPALDQSIRNWKDDWKALREKYSSRRGSSFVSGDESSTFSTMASPTSR